MEEGGVNITRVAILGCGPAGLFAAQAAAMHGLSPVIISKKQKSMLYGAQYLHKPIPGLTDIDSASEITTIRRGVEKHYAERVCGDGTQPTSWRRVQREAPCWNLQATYDVAWDKFAKDIVDFTLTNEDVVEFDRTFDLVISTVPRWAICM